MIDPQAWTQGEVTLVLYIKEAEHNFEKIEVDLFDPGKWVPNGATSSVGMRNRLHFSLS